VVGPLNEVLPRSMSSNRLRSTALSVRDAQGKINEKTTFDSSDFAAPSSFYAGGSEQIRRLVDLLGKIAQAKEGHTGSDRARLAAYPEAGGLFSSQVAEGYRLYSYPYLASAAR